VSPQAGQSRDDTTGGGIPDSEPTEKSMKLVPFDTHSVQKAGGSGVMATTPNDAREGRGFIGSIEKRFAPTARAQLIQADERIAQANLRHHRSCIYPVVSAGRRTTPGAYRRTLNVR
jgi:hypothetical protein